MCKGAKAEQWNGSSEDSLHLQLKPCMAAALNTNHSTHARARRPSPNLRQHAEVEKSLATPTLTLLASSFCAKLPSRTSHRHFRFAAPPALPPITATKASKPASPLSINRRSHQFEARVAQPRSPNRSPFASSPISFCWTIVVA